MFNSFFTSCYNINYNFININKLLYIYLYTYLFYFLNNYFNIININLFIIDEVIDDEYIASWVLLSPDMVLIFGIIVYILYFCWFGNKLSNNLFLAKILVLLCIITLIGTFFFLSLVAEFPLSTTFCNDLLVTSKHVIFIKYLILLTSICVFIVMFNNIEKENYLHIELPLFILFSVEGMFLLVSANNLFILYLALELQSLALYILCSINRHSNLSIEAGLKYFIFGSFSSAILLFGISLIYGITGTLDYYSLNIFLASDLYQNSNYINPVFLGLLFGVCCILVGLLFKLAIFPFHGWISDVFEGSPNIITFFFAIVPKISIVFVLYRILFIVFVKFIPFFYFLLLSCAIFSILTGSFLALYQIKIKRFFAYSAVVHMGYIVLSMCLGTWFGFYASFYYLCIYLISCINIFIIFLVICKYNKTTIKNIVDIVSIIHSNFHLSFIFVFNLLSLAGIPPLAGFYGKLFVFNILMQTGNYYIVFFIIFCSVVSCVYYIS